MAKRRQLQGRRLFNALHDFLNKAAIASTSAETTVTDGALWLSITASATSAGINAFVPRTHIGDADGDGKKTTHAVIQQTVAGILQGRRIAVKDNICTAGSATTCASASLHGFTNPVDATVVQRLRIAGARILEEKTNMDEFGMGSHSTHSVFGPVQSPGADNVLYSAGGSSGGSAMAVASGQCWAALGTDTGGSIRLPAAYTGVFGFKPSYGLISRNGVVAYANSLDTVGMITNTVFKLQQMLSVMSGHDAKDATSLPVSRRDMIAELPKWVADLGRPLRVGIPIEYNIIELDEVVREAWISVATTMQHAGAELRSISLPSTKAALSAYYVLAPAEASSNLARYDGVRFGRRGDGSDAASGTLYSQTRAQVLGTEAQRRILLGTYTLSSDAMNNYFVRAQRIRRLVQQDFDLAFHQCHILHDNTSSTPKDGVDVILCPTASTLAPSLSDTQSQDPVTAYTSDVLTVPASLAGLPAISMPFQSSSGPESNIGLQLIGQYGCDELLLDVASQLEFQGLVKSIAPTEAERIKMMKKSDATGFSPELARHYLHMRHHYGNALSAVQRTTEK